MTIIGESDPGIFTQDCLYSLVDNGKIPTTKHSTVYHIHITLLVKLIIQVNSGL